LPLVLNEPPGSGPISNRSCYVSTKRKEDGRGDSIAEEIVSSGMRWKNAGDEDQIKI
jgi:hypothetical protein